MTTRIVPEELVELDRPFAEFFRTLSGPWPFRPLFAWRNRELVAEIVSRRH